ncbi:alpha-ketoglutarate permease [Bacillus toyonensis]|nr:alpha-ketoglutarate permease [Bacillus toyonensis]PEO77448.1 alpha-ketoglutarate permease [Bacillus toyonensis]
MIKTLLAGAILSTGLVAGGAVGADGTTSFLQNFDVPKDAVPATPKEGAKTVEKTKGTGTNSEEGKMVETKVGAPEKREGAKTVEKTEGTGTDSEEGKMVETKE